MRKLFSLVAAVSLVVSAVYFCPPNFLSPDLDGPRNVYERASDSAVLIQAKRGTGVTIIRHTQAGNKVVFVWTAAHVVAGCNDVLVVRPIRSQFSKVGKLEFNSHVIYRNEAFDIALLQIEGSPTKYFSSAEFDQNIPPARGTKVFHCGNFLGEMFDGSLSVGVVSQIGVQSAPGSPWPVIDQTTTLIIPGSSGGPIFRDDNQKVVGLAVGIFGGQINVYVPARVLRSSVAWACDGTACPGLATLGEMRAKATVEIKPELLDLIFGH